MARNRLLIIITAVSALIIFFSADKYWAPFDEGIMTVGAQCVLEGKIPYRDFFLVMYPPGQVYLLALVYKVFGITLAAGRILAGVTQLLMAVVFFMFMREVTRKKYIWFVSWAVLMTCMAPRMGVIPTPIWTSVSLALCSLYFAALYSRGRFAAYLILSGVMAGVATVFRHDIGVFCVVSGALTVLLAGGAKGAIKFFAAAIPIPVIVFGMLILKGAGMDMWNSLIGFGSVHARTAALAFPAPCFDPRKIFHESLYFITANQYYIPLITSALAVYYLSLKRFQQDNVRWVRPVIWGLFAFCLLTFNQVRVRTDPAHLLTVIWPTIALFGIIVDRSFPVKHRSLSSGIFFGLIYLTAFLFALLAIKNLDKGIKNVVKKPLRGKVVMTRFGGSSVYIPEDESRDVSAVVEYLKERTRPGENIYLGNISHDVDDFGGTLLIYTLCGRMPAVKYYEILPGLITDTKVQGEMAHSLDSDGTRYLVLQDIDISGKMNIGENIRPGVLDSFIAGHYVLIKKTGKFGIYEKIGIH